MPNQYVGDYESNISTVIATLVAYELQRSPHTSPESIATTLERHAVRLRNDPPKFPEPEQRSV